jgi:hypothetical protein
VTPNEKPCKDLNMKDILKAMDEREKGHYYKLEEVFG